MYQDHLHIGGLIIAWGSRWCRPGNWRSKKPALFYLFPPSSMATIVEIVFLGTGTSGAVPNVSCLTNPEQSCKVCLSAMTPQGKKNMKKNTSLMVRFRSHHDPPNARLRWASHLYFLSMLQTTHACVLSSNVLIDCGKTFYGMMLLLSPHMGLLTRIY